MLIVLWYDSGFPNALPEGLVPVYDLGPTALLTVFL